MSRRRANAGGHDEGEFLWLVSLSDLMILLFVFFVVLFSFSFQKMNSVDMERIVTILKGEKDARTALDEVQAKVSKALIQKGLADEVNVAQKDGVLTLQIKEKMLFDSGRHSLKAESKDLMQLLAEAVESIPAPYRIGIEGHTDDVPMHNGDISDNWELSVKRAHTVLGALNLTEDLKKRTVIMGYGEMNPIVPNRDDHGTPIPENRSRNRRVTLRVF